jgi:uncharacterized protein (DUF1800 family)
MKKHRRFFGTIPYEVAGFFAALLVVSLTFAAPYVAADKKDKPARVATGRLPVTDLDENEAILHALNRLGFGPRPGDVERVRQMGLEKWIDRQLNPGSIDDSAATARLARFRTLGMSTEKLLEEFPTPQIAARRAGISQEEYRKQREEMARQREERQQRREEMESGDPMADRPRGRLGQAQDPNNPPMRMLEDGQNPQRIIAELGMAKMTRAIYSERQLNEMMVDFWFNHFNVFAAKGPDRWMVTSYERDVIRPNAMGKFGDLLHATAKSPAMLFYLDNWMSADPKAAEKMERELAERRQLFLRRFGGDPRMMGQGRGRSGQGRMPGQGQPGQPPPQQQNRRRGLNENYARELMELHTLGVDGGYTQQDVIEVARSFTGWTLQAPRRDPEFTFESRIHDATPKTVLGKKIDAGGMKDGEAVLDMLARHPNTARLISTKLARRFVSDNPPPALVDRMSKTFLDTDGDIRAVLRTMIYSPEFWARDAYRAKIKKPFELVASAARAVGAEVDVALPLVMWSARIGEPLYLCQPPTGYSDKAENWVNTGALLNRLNFTLALSANRMRGLRVNLPALVGVEAAADPKRALDGTLQLFLAGQVSPGTRATLEKQLTDPQVLRATLDDQFRQADVGVIAGLVLGTPEFQRR